MTSIRANYSTKNSNIATIVPDSNGVALLDPRYTQTFIIDCTSPALPYRPPPNEDQIEVTLDISPTIAPTYPAMKIVLLFKCLEDNHVWPNFSANFNISLYANRGAYVYNGNLPCLTLVSDGTAFVVDSFGPGFWYGCFSADSQIVMADGSLRTIDTICVGDLLLEGIVTAAMKINVYPDTPLYDVDGIVASGTHIIYKNGTPMRVCDSGAPRSTVTPSVLYTLNSTNHKIHIRGTNKDLVFADWDTIDEEDMQYWDQFIREKLGAPSSDTIFRSQAGLFSKVQLMTTTGPKNISDIQMGDLIADSHGFTEVIGTAKIHGSEVSNFNEIGSGATWIFHNKQWMRADDTNIFKDSDAPPEYLYSLFTVSGTFYVGSVLVRDFSEIGLTYDSSDFLLDKLNSKAHLETCHLVKEQLPNEIPMSAQLCQ